MTEAGEGKVRYQRKTERKPSRNDTTERSLNTTQAPGTVGEKS